MLPRFLIRSALIVFVLLTSCHRPDPVPAAESLPPLAPLAPADVVLYEVFVPRFSAAGTFEGVIPRLDSLRALGVNVLWLMPVHPTGLGGSPYCIRDYQAINPELGDLSAFDRLVREAHRRGLRVMLDWVANHTAWNHPWLSQHPDWYTQDANGRIVSPLPQWADVADLNYQQPDLRQEMIQTMRFWVQEHHVDGFRCDAADMVPDDFWQQAIRELRPSNPNLLWLAEGEKVSHYAAGFHLAFGWPFYSQLKNVFQRGASAQSLLAAHEQEMAGVPAGSYRLRFTTNHDEASWDNPPAVLFGGTSGAAAAYVATLAFGAAPLLYNGQEVGDPVRLNLPQRPIRWDQEPATAAVYRGLLRAYTGSAALRSGAVQVLTSSPDVVAAERTAGAERVLVLVNVRNYPVTLGLPASLRAVFWQDLLSGQPVTPPASLTLPAFGYALWQTK